MPDQAVDSAWQALVRRLMIQWGPPAAQARLPDQALGMLWRPRPGHGIREMSVVVVMNMLCSCTLDLQTVMQHTHLESVRKSLQVGVSEGPCGLKNLRFCR